MATCPKCGKEIDHLRCIVPVYMEENVTVVNGDIMYEETGTLGELDHAGLQNDYICPECDEVLFHTGDKAAILLLEEEDDNPASQDDNG